MESSEDEGYAKRDWKATTIPTTPRIKLLGPATSTVTKSSSSRRMKETCDKKSSKQAPQLKEKESIVKKPKNRAEARLQKIAKTWKSEAIGNLEERKKLSKERSAKVIESFCSIQNLKVKPEQCSSTKKQPVISEEVNHSGKVSFKIKCLSPRSVNEKLKHDKPTPQRENISGSVGMPVSDRTPISSTYNGNTFKRKIPRDGDSLQTTFKRKFEEISEPRLQPKVQMVPLKQPTFHSERLNRVKAAHASKLSGKKPSEPERHPMGTSKMTYQNKSASLTPSMDCSKKFQAAQGKNSHSLDFGMEMDWESIPDELVLSDIHSIRADIKLNDVTPMDVDIDLNEGMLSIGKDLTNSVIHLVIDTNVLISSLAVVKSLASSKIKGMRAHLVIPWQVLRELDHLKERGNSKVSVNARMASNYLLSLSSSHKKTIYFQSSHEELLERDNFVVEIPDDQIIKCCLQLQDQSHNVVLVTNDQNLRLKCIACKIVSASCRDLMTIYMGESSVRAGTYPFEETAAKTECLVPRIQKFAKVLNNFLSDLLKFILKELYGNMWIWFAPSEPPWTIKQTIKYAIDLLPKFEEDFAIKTNLECLKDLDVFFSRPNPETIKSEEFVSKLEKCKTFCKTMPVDYDPLLQPFLVEMKEIINISETNSDIQRERLVGTVVAVFQQYEDTIKDYCEKLSTSKNIDLQELVKNVRNLTNIIHALKIVRQVPCNKQINAHTKCAAELHSTLLSSLGKKVDNSFSLNAVTIFCFDKGIRGCLTEGIRCFEKFLKTMKSFAGDLAV